PTRVRVAAGVAVQAHAIAGALVELWDHAVAGAGFDVVDDVTGEFAPVGYGHVRVAVAVGVEEPVAPLAADGWGIGLAEAGPTVGRREQVEELDVTDRISPEQLHLGAAIQVRVVQVGG